MNDKLFQGYGYVYEVYKTRSFSKAAENLFISQSSLSSTIRKIEQRVGVEIFDRRTIPVGLTEDGAEYIRAIEKIMDIEEYFVARVEKTQGQIGGQLVVGGSNIYLSHVLPPVLSEFSKSFPGVQLRLIEGGSHQLEKQMADGLIDLAVDNRVLSEDSHLRIPMLDEILLLAVPAEYSINQSFTEYQLTRNDILADKHKSQEIPVVPLEQFRREPFILLHAGNDTRRRADQLFYHYNFAPKVSLKVGQQSIAHSLASHGIGATFVSDCVVRNILEEHGLVYYRLEPEFARRCVSLYYRKDNLPSRAMKEFLRITEETAF